MSSTAVRHSPPANPANAGSATAQIFTLASNNQVPCALYVPGKYAMEGKRFTVRGEGNLSVPVNTTTALFTLLGFSGPAAPASPLVIGSWTTVCAGGAQSGSTVCPWWLTADLICDSLSGLMHGTFQQMVMNKLTATGAITGVLGGLNGTNQPVVQAGPVTVQPSDPIATLALAVTFSVASATVANLMNFEIGF
jgi:hypothetical protein